MHRFMEEMTVENQWWDKKMIGLWCLLVINIDSLTVSVQCICQWTVTRFLSDKSVHPQ